MNETHYYMNCEVCSHGLLFLIVKSLTPTTPSHTSSPPSWACRIASEKPQATSRRYQMLTSKEIPCANGRASEKFTVLQPTNKVAKQEEGAHSTSHESFSECHAPSGTAHVLLPGITARFAAATSVLLTTCSVDVRRNNHSTTTTYHQTIPYRRRLQSQRHLCQR
jgi:hypothetical protein